MFSYVSRPPGVPLRTVQTCHVTFALRTVYKFWAKSFLGDVDAKYILQV